MKKPLLAAIAAMLLLCGCEPDKNTEETDILPQPELTEQTISAEETSASPLSPETEPKHFKTITFNLNNPDAISPEEFFSRHWTADSVTVMNCGDNDLSFLRESGCSYLTLYGFSGRVADYEELFGELNIMQLYIYTLPDSFYPEDMEALRNMFPEYISVIYSDAEVQEICGNNVPIDSDSLWIDSPITKEDAEKIGRMGKISVVVEYPDPDISLLTECENIHTLYLKGFEGDVNALADSIGKMPKLEAAEIYVSSYSSADSNTLLSAAPLCSITYMGTVTEGEYDPEGLGFFMYPSAEAYQEHWYKPQLYFSNGTDSDAAVNSIRLYYDNGSEWEAVPLEDGSLEYDPQLIIAAGDTIEYYPGIYEDPSLALENDLFDFTKHPSGLYKVCADMGGETLESVFLLTLPPDFGSTDMEEAFKAAEHEANELTGELDISEEYAVSHTAEEFIAEYSNGLTDELAWKLAKREGYIDAEGNVAAFGSDKPGNIMISGINYSILSRSENEMLLKCTLVYWHGDSPYGISLSEYNLHMIKTEEGFRFDNFKYWY